MTSTNPTDGTPKNLSFVLESRGKLKFEDRPVPTLHSPHDVLIHIRVTGICGSDVHYWTAGAIGPYIVQSPMVLGHESAGVVAAVGPAVTSLRIGDRVALEPGVPCRRCERCKAGAYNQCAAMTFAATPPVDGTLAKYYVLPEDFCYKLPEHVSLDEGALVEPLSVAVHVVRRAAVRPGQSVVVFGAGPVGLLCCAVARAFGARKVVAVDIRRERLDFAAGFAASAVFMPLEEPAAENARRLVAAAGLGEGADVVLDASGAQASVQTGIHALRVGGTYVQAGMGAAEVVFPITEVCVKEVTVRGSFRYAAGDYKLAVELIATGAVQVGKLVTGRWAFEEAEKAFEEVRAGRGIKALIDGVRE
ncbi:MAG: hypothetical protein M1829_001021 [Trizodia sp. TS-e1964]|nr:MAG: hypothetical protein M1829_001021 [Trizodia sp. TS-e1964]